MGYNQLLSTPTYLPFFITFLCYSLLYNLCGWKTSLNVIRISQCLYYILVSIWWWCLCVFHSGLLYTYFNCCQFYWFRYNPPITINSMTDLSQERGDRRRAGTKIRKTKVILFQAEGTWNPGSTRGTFKKNKGKCKKT